MFLLCELRLTRSRLVRSSVRLVLPKLTLACRRTTGDKGAGGNNRRGLLWNGGFAELLDPGGEPGRPLVQTRPKRDQRHERVRRPPAMRASASLAQLGSAPVTAVQMRRKKLQLGIRRCAARGRFEVLSEALAGRALLDLLHLGTKSPAALAQRAIDLSSAQRGSSPSNPN
jgi:hypothetical protein